MPSAGRESGRAITAITPSAAGPRTGELLPVGKAYFGFTDEELKWLDRWIRGHTIERFGPVREVEKEPGSRGRVRFDPQEHAAQVGPGDALPPHQPNQDRQTGG